MSKNFADPVNHSTTSAAMKTGTETVKGATLGAGEGFFTGPVFGAIGGIVVGGLAAAAILSPLVMGGAALVAIGEGTFLAATATGLGYAGGVGAIVGGLTGAAGGSVLGPIAGFFAGGSKGVNTGREIIAHDRGVAELSNQQTATAMAQANTAQALQTGIMEQAQIRQHQHESQMVAAMAGPQIQAQGANYMGRMNETALSQEAVNDSALLASEAGHAAATMEQRDAAANAEHQV